MKYLVCFLFFGLVWGCRDIENCDADTNQDFFVLSFYDLETTAAKKVAFEISAQGRVFGEGDYAYSADSTSVSLPLNPESNQVTFTLDSPGVAVVESLVLSYEKKVSLFDPDCPPSLYYEAIDTVFHTFDSLTLPGRITNSQIETNVAVYFR